MDQTLTVAHLAKAIYILVNEMGLKPSTLAIGRHLNVSGHVVRKLLASSAVRGYVKRSKHQPIKLLPKGEELALKQIRAHRLWETYLHRTMGFDLQTIHIEATRLEFNSSDLLINRIGELLGEPLFDLHGDPIPSATGEMADVSDLINLDKLKAGDGGMVVRLCYHTPEFTLFCDRHAMNIGAEITVISKEDSGGVNIQLGDSVIYAAKETARQIFITKAYYGSDIE